MTSPSPWSAADPARSAAPGAPDQIATLAAAIRSIENGEGDPTLPAAEQTRGANPLVERSAPRAKSRGRDDQPPVEQAHGANPSVERSRDDRELEQQARAIVLRKLTVRARTRTELADALTAAEIPEHIATPVLDRMTEVGLVDDAAFAQEWVASRQARRNLSRRKLADELRRKGVAPETISLAVDTVDDSDEYEAALDLARRKAPSLARHDPVTQRRRLAGVLDRRGFSTGVVQRVLREVLEPLA